MIILINGHSASSSEVVAAALQGNERAKLVGSRTYGKGTMESLFTLENKFVIKLTTAALYSPNGRSWQSHGVIPDIYVDQSFQTFIQAKNTKDLKRRLIIDMQLKTAHTILSFNK